jgi:hypothetical protein
MHNGADRGQPVTIGGRNVGDEYFGVPHSNFSDPTLHGRSV